MTLDTRGGLATQSTVAGSTGVLAESMVRDELGRISERTVTDDSGTHVYAYTYDARGHLTEVRRDGLTVESYTYDASGGLTSRGTGLLASWIETDGHGRPISAADGTQATWNDDGELTQLTTSTGSTGMQYDGFGRLTQLTLPDGKIGRYRYDALGRRTAVRLDGQLVRRYVYGGSEWPQARIDAGGDVLERYVYASQAHVPDMILRRDGQRLRLVLDATGSVRATIDADTGQILQRLAYDSYGRVTQDTNPGLQPFAYKGAITDPVAEGAGLLWMGVRAYTPQLARFTTPDPAGLAAGWNQHDALAGDPINLVDPDGRWPSRQDIANTSAGIGDGMLGLFCLWQCNFGQMARENFGIQDKVDTCSDAYGLGYAAGQAAAMAGAGAWGAGALASRFPRIYRAVGPDELDDIQRVGRYRVPPGGTEGKYFFPTRSQAEKFGEMMPGGPYRVTSVRVSQGKLNQANPIAPAREGSAYFFPANRLPSGPVSISRSLR